jgi:hypothetical protein
VPGPVRVFPGAVLVGNRPGRLAGVRLLDSSDAQVGAVIVAGAEPALRLVDANNVLGSARHLPGIVAQPAQKIPLDPAVPAIDVVASDQPGHVVRAFAVTDASAGGVSILLGFDLTVSGGAPQMTPVQHCTLDFAPSRLAVVPGPDDLVAPDGPPRHVYVADGTPNGTPGGIGDGAVEVDVQSMAAFTAPLAPCTVRRLAASDPADQPPLARPLRSIALNPVFWKATPLPPDAGPDTPPPPPTPVAGGQFLMGATLPNDALCGFPAAVPPPDPSTVATTASDPTCGGGRIVFVAVNPGGTSQVMRAPRGGSTDVTNQPPGDPPMEPLRPSFTAREVSFLLPRLGCIDADTGVQRPSGFCTDVTAGTPGSGVTLFYRPIQLGAAAVLDDGSTAIVNAGDLRFLTDQFDIQSPSVTAPAFTTTPVLNPSVNPGTDVVELAFPNDATVYPTTNLVNPCPQGATGCMTPGVTRTLRWQAVWRSRIPGLETVTGTLHRDTADSPIRLQLPAGKSLDTWISSPMLQFQAGDLVRLVGFAPPPTRAVCDDVKNFPTLLDMTITKVTSTSIEFTAIPSPADGSYQGFNPDPACIEDLGAAVEVVTGDTPAGEWLILAGQDVRGRVKQGQQFVGYARRFDYPPVTEDLLPPTGIEMAFAPTGIRPGQVNNPTWKEFDARFDGTAFTWAVVANDSPTSVRDLTSLQGFADGLLVYQNRNAAGGLFYVSLTGTNALLQASYPNLGATGAVAIYR